MTLHGSVACTAVGCGAQELGLYCWADLQAVGLCGCRVVQCSAVQRTELCRIGVCCTRRAYRAVCQGASWWDVVNVPVGSAFELCLLALIVKVLSKGGH